MREKLFLKILIFALSLGFSATDIFGQDVHYTLFNQNPLLFNPAKTGAFYGTFRIAGIYRDQYRTATSNFSAFKTPSFSIDAPIVKGFKENDWVGVGVSFFADRSGTLGQQWTGFKLSGAYHLVFGDESNNVLTLAYQTGSVSQRFKNIDRLSLSDPDEIEMIKMKLSDPDNGNSIFIDHVAGFRYLSKYNHTDNFEVGLALSRFGKPDFSIIDPQPDPLNPIPAPTANTYRLNPKLVAQAAVSFQNSEKLRIEPSAQLQLILGLPEYEFQFQTQGVYLLNKKKRTSLIAGAGIRFGGPIDAISFLTGLERKEVKVILAYDANVSGLSSLTGGFGGLELSAIYIGQIFKRPNPDPIIYCPRF